MRFHGSERSECPPIVGAVKKVKFTEPAEPASAPSLRRSTKVRTAATISAEKQRAVSDAQRRPAARTKPKEAQAALRMVRIHRRYKPRSVNFSHPHAFCIA